MPYWYYEMTELRNTPSIKDGIDYETERRYRKEGARLISEIGAKMELGYNTVATGVVYFHRFYMFRSFKNFPRYVTACCCLFLAGKVEETPKKCSDIIMTARILIGEEKYKTFGKNPKTEVMILERILLQTIKFNLEVEHPYRYLLEYAKTFKGNKKKLQNVVQMAWVFVNDSLGTTLSLQWEPEIIAVALMHLAARLSKFKIEDWEGKQPNHTRWWDLFVEDMTNDLLEDICHQVLDLYSSTDNKLASEIAAMSSDSNETDTNESPTASSDRPASNASIATTATIPPNDIPPVNVQHGLPRKLEGVPMEVPSHYPPYTTAFTHGNSAYPPVFPSASVAMPPPVMNYIVPPMHMNAGLPPLHQPYYPPNGNIYHGGSSAPMPGARPYYFN